MFGYPFPETVKRERYWGARAIYKVGDIDLLGDRQTCSDKEDSPALKEFLLWLNGYALPWLRREVKKLNLATNDPKEIVLHQFKYELRASTNGSYGYLYIGAIEHTLVECEPHLNKATGKSEKVVMAGDVKFVVDDGVVPVGTTGVVNCNKIGPVTVVGYHNDHYNEEVKLACLMVVAHNPPEWMLTQHCQNDAEKLVKDGFLPREKGCEPRNYPDHKSKAFKEWKKNWKIQPFSIWPNDVKVNVEVPV